MFKLITNTLSNNIILFINNYFIYIKLIIALKDRRTTIYKTINLDRKDLLKLLIKIKSKYIKNIFYEVLTIII